MRRRQPSKLPPDAEILNLLQLAEYLMVSEKTIYRMTEKRQIPAFRVGSHWRFRKVDIDAWLSDQVRRVEVEGQPALVDEINTLEEMTVSSLLEPENTWVALAPIERDELLSEMVSRASLDSSVNREKLTESILRREAICSTALLDDVAFPHPVKPEEFKFTRKRILIASLSGPSDFRDRHGHRPSLIVLILARSLQGHLLVLSRALKLFGSPALVASLRVSRSPEEVISRIVEFESSLLGAPGDLRKNASG